MKELTKEEIELLQDFSGYEGTEIGETIDKLLEVYSYKSYFSEDLLKELLKELRWFITDIKENFVKEELIETKSWKIIQWIPK